MEPLLSIHSNKTAQPRHQPNCRYSYLFKLHLEGVRTGQGVRTRQWQYMIYFLHEDKQSLSYDIYLRKTFHVALILKNIMHGHSSLETFFSGVRTGHIFLTQRPYCTLALITFQCSAYSSRCFNMCNRVYIPIDC